VITHFVGRRPFEAPEVYAVSRTSVERLRSTRRFGTGSLDWRGSEREVMELSHALLMRVARRAPSHELASRFALGVIVRLSEDGFVLHADEIRAWLDAHGGDADFMPPAPRRRAWPGRLLGVMRRPGTPRQ
jgi:hypothetical protein